MAGHPCRGDIYIVNFDPTRGSEQRGSRPALVVSNDVANEHSPVVTVVAITRTIPRRQYPQNVHLPSGPLREPGTVFCGQLLTVSKERLGNYMGHVDSATMVEVDEALRAHLHLGH